MIRKVDAHSPWYTGCKFKYVRDNILNVFNRLEYDDDLSNKEKKIVLLLKNSQVKLEICINARNRYTINVCEEKVDKNSIDIFMNDDNKYNSRDYSLSKTYILLIKTLICLIRKFDFVLENKELYFDVKDYYNEIRATIDDEYHYWFINRVDDALNENERVLFRQRKEILN